MGTCIYCGKPAGFLRSKHRECEEKRKQGLVEMARLARNAALGEGSEGSFEKLPVRLAEIAKDSFISPEEIRAAYIVGWGQAVSHFLEDGNLDPQEERQLTLFANHFGLTQTELDKTGGYTQFLKGIVLRELMEGKIPSRFRPVGVLPFNFQKNESLIWVFKNVDYYEERTYRQYVGGTRGMSFRIAKGVYYRTGSFRGHPVETTEKVHLGTGTLAVTTKHLYFHGSRKAFRVRFDKIVSFTPFSDGVAIQRDAATAKPQFFITGDGWFTYNLLVNASQLS